MSHRSIQLWSGTISLLTGILWSIGTLILYLASQYNIGSSLAGEALRFSSSLCFILVIVALYRPQIQPSGKMGFVSFILAMLGSALNIIPEYLLLSALSGSSSAVLEMSNPSWIASITPYAYMIGMVWFGISTLFSGVFPIWGAFLFTAGLFLTSLTSINEVFPFILLPIGAFLGGVGLVWMGWMMLRLTSQDEPKYKLPQ